MSSFTTEGVPMSKKMLLAALAGVGYLVYRQMRADRNEQDLWHEATDTVPSAESH